jgi:hypothetical protein
VAKVRRVDTVTGKHWQPSASAVLCSAHFLPTDFYNSPWLKNRLKPNAVPSVFSYVVCGHAIVYFTFIFLAHVMQGLELVVLKDIGNWMASESTSVCIVPIQKIIFSCSIT